MDAVDLDACHLNFGSMDGDPELADETYASLQPLYTETAAAQHEGGFAVLDDADADFILPDDDANADFIAPDDATHADQADAADLVDLRSLSWGIICCGFHTGLY